MNETHSTWLKKNLMAGEKKEFNQAIPPLPGVYLFFDQGDKLLYVGKANNLQQRLWQYRLADGSKKRRKMKDLFEKLVKIKIEFLPTTTTALLRENHLIKELQPQYNISGAFFFTYPYLGYKKATEPQHQVTLVYSTNEQVREDPNYSVYGAYRSRADTREAFTSLGFLLGFIGHANKKKKKSNFEFTCEQSFRQIRFDWQHLIEDYLGGKNFDLLRFLTEQLLSKASARQQSQAVQQSLKVLKSFWKSEVLPLRNVMEKSQIEGGSIAQKKRDQLFIKFR